MTHFHFTGRSIPGKLRLKWQDPEIILHKIGLKPGNTFIDVGCGDGYFTLPAAGIVGDKGKVYGVDINESAINELKETILKQELNNIELSVGTAEETVFCEGCADIVFFGIDLHDFERPSPVLQNARKMLKPSGKLIDLDFKKIHMDFGPPFEKRFNEEKAKNIIENAGFKVESIEDMPPFSYLIVARPFPLK